MPVRIGGYYLLAWMGPGAWVGALCEGLFGGVPEGWYFCFPNPTPAFVSGFVLTLLLPLVRPPRLRAIPFAVWGTGAPLLVTSAWLAVQDPPLLHNLSLRWWLSNQIPGMLVAAACAVYGAFEQMRLDAAETPVGMRERGAEAS
jgi:hypothetical protein